MINWHQLPLPKNCSHSADWQLTCWVMLFFDGTACILMFLRKNTAIQRYINHTHTISRTHTHYPDFARALEVRILWKSTRWSGSNTGYTQMHGFRVSGFWGWMGWCNVEEQRVSAGIWGCGRIAFWAGLVILDMFICTQYRYDQLR